MIFMISPCPINGIFLLDQMNINYFIKQYLFIYNWYVGDRMLVTIDHKRIPSL